MHNTNLAKMRKAHKVLAEFRYDPVDLDKGYSNRTLRIDISKNTIEQRPVTQEMKDLWIGGKGFDLWLMLQEISKDTKWDSPENPICMSSGPLGGTASFPGSGKTLVTSISPTTHSIMDCNVGGYFGPYMKFAGFDALCLIGKAEQDVIIYINAPERKITIEEAPLESIDSHLAAEEFTEMYANDELDRRNISVVSSGRAAEHTRLGLLNFSFYDWRRKVPRLKQAGRGGVGTVFRNKKVKALVIKSEPHVANWEIAESKVAEKGTPSPSTSHITKEDVKAIAKKWNNNPDYVTEMMLDIQEKDGFISKAAVEYLSVETGTARSQLFHIATSYHSFTLAPKQKDKKSSEPSHIIQGSDIKILDSEDPVVLRHIVAAKASKIDKIEDALAGGVYKTFEKLVKARDKNSAREKVIDEITESGLRGRGGEGKQVALRWQRCREGADARKVPLYIGCNADEGDPASFKDRMLLESDPHTVIEGMLIAAYATGATEGFIYVRKDYVKAVAKLEKALKDAEKKGFLGEDILGTNFSFNIKLRLGAGAYVAGGFSAMMAALSGQAAEPTAHFQCECQVGYKGHPTVLHNVETWANIPIIMEKGGKWFSAIKAKIPGKASSKVTATKSPGTKVFSLTGHIRNSGVAEVPMGTTLREIIEGCGGGIPKGKKIKAIQIGGPSGGFLPEDRLDMKVDFDSLKEAGVMMGSASIIVMDEETSIVDAVRHNIKFCLEESCGKCTPCREGLYAAYNTLTRICDGHGKTEDLELLEDLASTIQETSLCGLGQYAVNPLTSSFRYFKKEYEKQIKDKKPIRKTYPEVCINAKILNTIEEGR